MLDTIRLDHPFNPQPEGEHFFTETGWQRLDQIIHGLFVLSGLKFILKDGQTGLNAIVSILMNKGGGGRGFAALRLSPLLPSPQIYRQGSAHGSTSGEEVTEPTMDRMADLSGAGSFAHAVTMP